MLGHTGLHWTGAGEVTQSRPWMGAGEVTHGLHWTGAGEVTQSQPWMGAGEVTRGLHWTGAGEVAQGWQRAGTLCAHTHLLGQSFSLAVPSVWNSFSCNLWSSNTSFMSSLKSHLFKLSY